VPFGSLIFVVIIAVWAAYLIQHWIRRRDHVATARSVDRFSEAMRVLERRRRMPAAEPSAPAPPTHAAAPARPAHPDVAVKRAESRRRPQLVSAPTGRDGRTVRRLGAVLRALVLVTGALSLAAGAVATALSLAPWWTAPAGAGVFVLAVGVVRLTVPRRTGTSARRRSRRPSRATAAPAPARTHARRPVDHRITTAPVAAARVRGSAPLYVPAPRRVEAVAAERPAPATAPVAATADHLAPTAQRSTPDLYDLQAVEAAAADPVPAAPAAEPEPGTWQPVPVPPPTYTLKARAHRPAGSVPAPATQPVQDLPFDGHAMALEEEFEELPAVNLG
jgi:hypothetical protein